MVKTLWVACLVWYWSYNVELSSSRKSDSKALREDAVRWLAVIPTMEHDEQPTHRHVHTFVTCGFATEFFVGVVSPTPPPKERGLGLNDSIHEVSQ